jgi:hypothetical protein
VHGIKEAQEVSVTFFGGPLDGCVEPAATDSVRIFPNPVDPENRVVVYMLMSFPALRYHYDPIATEKANLKLAKDRGLLSDE